MKNNIIVAAIISFALTCSSQAVTYTGTSLLSTSGSISNFAIGDVGIFINNDNNANWNLFNGAQIDPGLSLFSSSTFTPVDSPSASFSFLGNRTASGGGSSVALGGIPAFNLGGGISSGDEFAVMVFSSSTSTTVAGDTYAIWRASDWIQQGNNSASIAFQNPVTSGISQITGGSPIVTGSVVPEPSTYALVALGGLALFFIARRRKAQQV